MRFNNRLGIGQSQPCTTSLTAPRDVGPKKPFGDEGIVLVRNPFSCVVDRDLNLSIGLRHSHCDIATFRIVAERIGQQVVGDLPGFIILNVYPLT